MATMKDVAKLAGVSVSTVSIVINGKAKERSIPTSTYDKVMHAIEELNYRPNITARRLRSSNETKVFVLFWPFDARTEMLGTLLSGIQKELAKQQYTCEVLVRTYTNNKIEHSFRDALNNMYDGIIIGGTSEQDLNYLESISIHTPVVLINRESQKYSTVYVSEYDIAQTCVQLLKERNIREIGVIRSTEKYVASSQRIESLIQSCKNSDIKADICLSVSDSYEGGILAATKYLELSDHPKYVICESDVIALGMLYEFNHQKIRIPEELSLLTLGSTHNDYTAFCTPSLSVIALPSEAITSHAITQLIKLSKDSKLPVMHDNIPPEINLRESFI